MPRFRLARPAQADLTNILATSAERWGAEGRRRYAAILVAAMRQAAAEPEGALARNRPELAPGLRSFHVRYARSRPDVLYYRVAREGVIEILRVLHERMEPSRHLDELPAEGDVRTEVP